jgi:hypothetical protein
MIMNTIQRILTVLSFLTFLWLTGCSTSKAPDNGSTATENKSLAPKRVDIRGNIIMSRYDQGQVVLEVEGFPSPDSRYTRAYVLVTPITQIIDKDGRTMSLNELHQGQNVAIQLRAGGDGTFVGIGVARKMWIEESF